MGYGHVHQSPTKTPSDPFSRQHQKIWKRQSQHQVWQGLWAYTVQLNRKCVASKTVLGQRGGAAGEGMEDILQCVERTHTRTRCYEDSTAIGLYVPSPPHPPLSNEHLGSRSDRPPLDIAIHLCRTASPPWLPLHELIRSDLLVIVGQGGRWTRRGQGSTND